jgi:hypothetical protein
VQSLTHNLEGPIPIVERAKTITAHLRSNPNPSANNKNYDQTVEEYDALRKLAHRLDIAIIVVHHCKKSSDVSTAPLEKVIGSIGITGTAETILVMEQQTGSKDCKLHVTGKDVEQCEKYLSWNGNGFNIEDDVREAQLGPIQSWHTRKEDD